jgi:hypothetical protein
MNNIGGLIRKVRGVRRFEWQVKQI